MKLLKMYIGGHASVSVLTNDVSTTIKKYKDLGYTVIGYEYEDMPAY